ncbi:MAG: hypothetical protein GEV08_10000 [Acidimicrobiia bacterium]|nr:hypothetical protein [Acidimicrobiia bacterium]
MQDRPTAAELLATIEEYLTGEVLPNVSGTLRYHTLVAANMVRILEREAEQYPGAVATEREALCSLLGIEPVGRAEGQVAALNAALADRLRNGSGPAFERDALEVLLPATKAKLDINKPGYDSYDMAAEVNLP